MIPYLSLSVSQWFLQSEWFCLSFTPYQCNTTWFLQSNRAILSVLYNKPVQYNLVPTKSDLTPALRQFKQHFIKGSCGPMLILCLSFTPNSVQNIAWVLHLKWSRICLCQPKLFYEWFMWSNWVIPWQSFYTASLCNTTWFHSAEQNGIMSVTDTKKQLLCRLHQNTVYLSAYLTSWVTAVS